MSTFERLKMNWKRSLTLLCFTILISSSTVETREDIKIGVILPMSTEDLWILPKTSPAIDIAVKKVMKRENLLRGRKILVTYEDSKCDETEGPLRAIDMYVKKSAHVFLGPACNYAVAPVARFSYSWNIPVISAGALVSAFEDKSEYKLLTRIMGSYAKLGHFVEEAFDMFDWSVVGLLYSSKKGPNDGRSSCYFAVEPLFHAMTRKTNQKPWHESFDEEDKVLLDYGKLLTKASKHTRSK
ncbi:hypothetical protein SNE40_007305 [Patella caerulea]|uniref:Receptor ligand binding region domain-containing protein n=2 Tax=Patella caerulea TaxID=87958 RepID=A0AAN8JTJ0_PATCE